MARQTKYNFWSKVLRGGPDECWPWQGSQNNTGYGTVGWGGHTFTAHRVAAWLEGLVAHPAAPADRKAGGFVLHQCDNRLCCNPNHMRIGTYAENQAEAYARRRRAQPKGEAHAGAKFTNEQAEAIRHRYTAGGITQDALAAEYGVSQVAISLVIRGRTY